MPQPPGSPKRFCGGLFVPTGAAAARSGTAGAPMRIGEKTYQKGLGHHANGEIVIDNCANVNTSFPGFVDLAAGLGSRVAARHG